MPFRHTLYEDIGPNRRARAHRRVAEALEVLCAIGPGFERVNLPATGSPPSRRAGKAITYSQQAGDAALAALAPADALRHYRQALDLSSRAPAPDPASKST